MTLRFFDTAAREVRDFVPRTPGAVSMYVCGPTVYDVPHLGHGRTAVVFDLIRRYLAWSGNQVTFVSNITDIEDRIITRATERGISTTELTTTYERAYWDEMDRLLVLRPDAMPHATEFVDEMLALIAQLIERGHAYVIEGSGVYFQVDTLPDYGALARRNLAQLLDDAGQRVEVDEEKRSPVDFALWKAAKPGEPTWDSPWGPGRPGWHIECSAMSLEILGDGFDIHGGGDDLVFPHHENEIAQSVGAGHPFARYWLHSGMVNVDGVKMAKSLGNFTNLADAIDQHGPRAFRLLVAQHHYRTQLEINEGTLRAAAAAVDRLDALVRRARAAGVPDATPGDTAAFRAAMDDDFNTPQAVAAIMTLVRDANSALDGGDLNAAAGLVATVRELAGVLGLTLDEGGAADDDAEIAALVEERTAARAARDFAAADRVRDELAARGIVLEDTPQGTVWHRAGQ